MAVCTEHRRKMPLGELSDPAADKSDSRSTWSDDSVTLIFRTGPAVARTPGIDYDVVEKVPIGRSGQ